MSILSYSVWVCITFKVIFVRIMAASSYSANEHWKLVIVCVSVVLRLFLVDGANCIG